MRMKWVIIVVMMSFLITGFSCTGVYTADITQLSGIIAPEKLVKVTTWEYGKSGKERPLIATKIEDPKTTRQDGKTVMLVFAIHGFEDAWHADGRELVKIANEVINYFTQNPNKLNGNKLIVVPCANIDGVTEGWTNNGPGRNQISKGIDLNRDFAYNFKTYSNNRNKTLYQAFSAPESKALSNLVLSEQPDVVIDFHGWFGETFGDGNISKFFDYEFGLKHATNNNYGRGYFTSWADSQQYKDVSAVLVEYPNPFTGKGTLTTSSSIDEPEPNPINQWDYAGRTIKAIEGMFQSL